MSSRKDSRKGLLFNLLKLEVETPVLSENFLKLPMKKLLEVLSAKGK